MERTSSDYPELNEFALAVGALGILTDRAVSKSMEPVVSGEAHDGRRKKTMGILVAAFWVEAIRDWTDERPDLNIEVGEHYEGGWPEFKVDDHYHVRVGRYDNSYRSARSAALASQVPDLSMGWWQDALPGMTPDEGCPINVNMVAQMDLFGHVVGLQVIAPTGADEPLFNFQIDKQEADRLAEQWEQERPVWVDHVMRVAALRLPSEAAPLTPAVQGDHEEVGRQFTAEGIPAPSPSSSADDNDAQADQQNTGDGIGRFDESQTGTD